MKSINHCLTRNSSKCDATMIMRWAFVGTNSLVFIEMSINTMDWNYRNENKFILKRVNRNSGFILPCRNVTLEHQILKRSTFKRQNISWNLKEELFLAFFTRFFSLHANNGTGGSGGAYDVNERGREYERG